MIETERLQIKFAKMDDLDDMYEYVSDKKVMKYERENYPTKESYAKALEWLTKNKLMHAIRLKNQSKVIGHIYLGKRNPEINNEYNIGYILNLQYHNKGYCSEACKAVMQYGFTVLKANRIRAACNPKNIASWKVMEKIGLKKEGFFKKRFYLKDDESGQPIYTDEVTYGIHVSDWEKSNQ